jgi:hypothetical protein
MVWVCAGADSQHARMQGALTMRLSTGRTDQPASHPPVLPAASRFMVAASPPVLVSRLGQVGQVSCSAPTKQ